MFCIELSGVDFEHSGVGFEELAISLIQDLSPAKTFSLLHVFGGYGNSYIFGTLFRYCRYGRSHSLTTFFTAVDTLGVAHCI